MREIKFRAWDGQKMFNVDVLAISPCGWSCPDYGKKGVSLAYQPSVKAMQYTGLKDKNGKEIYEGDLVTINQEDEEDIFEIEWDECTSRFIMSCDSHYTCDFDNYNGSDCEIIGNIYENPELLNGGN